MYTLIRESDDAVHFRTHGPPGELSPEQARRVLLGLSPVLADLRRRAFGGSVARPSRRGRRQERGEGRKPAGTGA